MFSFFRRKPSEAAATVPAKSPPDAPDALGAAGSGLGASTVAAVPAAAPAPKTPLDVAVEPALETPPEPPRSSWIARLKQGLRKTGSGIAQVFTGTRIDDALYEELESALLMADAGCRFMLQHCRPAEEKLQLLRGKIL